MADQPGSAAGELGDARRGGEPVARRPPTRASFRRSSAALASSSEPAAPGAPAGVEPRLDARRSSRRRSCADQRRSSSASGAGRAPAARRRRCRAAARRAPRAARPRPRRAASTESAVVAARRWTARSGSRTVRGIERRRRRAGRLGATAMMPHTPVDEAYRRRLGPAPDGRTSSRRRLDGRRSAVGRARRPRRSVGRLDHHPHQRLGAARPHQHPAVVAQLGLDRGDRPRRGARRRRCRCSATRTLRSTCGSRVMAASASSAERAPGRRTQRRAAAPPVSRPSPVVARSAEDHVPALLAAERAGPRRPAPRARSGRRPALSTTSMPCSRHGEAEPEVGHHGDDHGVVGEPPALVAVDGADGDDLVAVDEPRRRRRPRSTRSASPSKASPTSAPALDHRLLQVLRVGRAAAGVDVGAVGLGRG